ncbi:hypothetical protein FOA52_002909 [Chlamydomonas sp. UWO 241]|nr:hypothetical protein FOA52_002909 [Chlamydomonas sp. UWO 241]
MACLRGMLTGAFFPHLESLRLLLPKGGAIEDPADYQAIASTSPWLTELSMKLPASATTLPQQMAALLAACGRGRAVSWHQLQRLELSKCLRMCDLELLAMMVNLQRLDYTGAALCLIWRPEPNY